MKSLLCFLVPLCLLCGCHRNIELGDFREDSRDDTPGRLVIKTRPVVMHFKENKHDFDALVGAAFDKGEHAEARIRNSFSRFYLDKGFVYLAGAFPFVETSVIATIAEGTSYAVQIDGSTQRVYLLSAGRGHAVKINLAPGVASLPGATTSLTLSKQRFATIKPDANGNYSIVDSGAIQGNNDVDQFIQDLRDSVKAAGLLPTWPANLP